MITLVKEREMVGMSSPFRLKLKRGGTRTPGCNTPGGNTPRRSSAAWYETDVTPGREFYATTPRSPYYNTDIVSYAHTPSRGSATPRRPPEFMGNDNIPTYTTGIVSYPQTPTRGSATPRRPPEFMGMTDSYTPEREYNTTPRRHAPSDEPESGTPRQVTMMGRVIDLSGYKSPVRGGSATPRRPSDFMNSSTTTPQRQAHADETEIGTPRRVTMMGREIDMGGCKSPQHPQSGTNNWGGESPLMSRNIPKESMETSYVRFNPLSDLDYSTGDEDVNGENPVQPAKKVAPPRVSRPSPGRYDRNGNGGKTKKRGFFSKWKWWKKGKKYFGGEEENRRN